MIEIGIFIFDDAEELDFVGPFEVYTMINTVLENQDKPNGVNVRLISETGQDITGKKGMRVGAHAKIADVSRLDVLCVPGGYGSRVQMENQRVLDWIGKVAPTCIWVTSVCTGAFILAKSGLTKEKRISTFWGAFDEFKSRGLDGELVPRVRFVRDGNLVTSAGVSAGIDMSLWVTGQLFSPEFARLVQRGMQYDPAPPYTADT